MKRSRPRSSRSIAEIRDSLVKRFKFLVRVRAVATGMQISEFQEWVDGLVGEGIAVALGDIDKWEETRGDFLYWAFLKTRNLVTRDLRKMKARVLTTHYDESELVNQGQDHDPSKRLIIQEQLQAILNLLTKSQSEALVLRYLANLSVQEMQEFTGRTDVSIYSLLQRAKQKARKSVTDWKDLPRPGPLKSNCRRDRKDTT